MRSSTLALLFAAVAPAQVFIVDAAGGPGSSFTSISAAVASVPNGAVLQVRTGTYAPFAINGKGLTILGLGGVEISGAPFAAVSISIAGTTPTQPVVLRDLHMRVPFGGFHRLFCTNCQGPVLLQRVSMDGFYGIYGTLAAQQCAQLFVDACGPFRDNTAASLDISGGSAVVSNTSVLLGWPALRANGSRVEVVDSALFGAPAIRLLGGTARLAGQSTISGWGPAIGGTGTLFRDPGVAVSSSIEPGVTDLVAPQSRVVATGGTLGTTANAALSGPAGHFGVLFLGQPAAPVLIAGVTQALWIDLAQPFAGVATGVLGTPLTATVAVPANPALLGKQFLWQGLTFDAVAGFGFSVPALFTP